MDMIGLGAIEFVGPFEPNGWKLSAGLVPIDYIGWSIWLLAPRNRPPRHRMRANQPVGTDPPKSACHRAPALAATVSVSGSPGDRDGLPERRA